MDIALDIETAGLNCKNFLLGCIIRDDRKKPIYFYEPDKMYKYIINLGAKEKKYGHKLNVYAHNHLYDFSSYAQNYLTKIGKDEIKRIKKKTPIMYLLHNNIYILDTMNLFGRIPLEKLGKMLGLPKKEMPKTLLKEDKNWSLIEINMLKPYITRDTEIVLESIKHLKQALQKIPDIGHKPRKVYTASGISYNFFKQYCRKNKHAEYFWQLNKKGTIHKSKHFDQLSKAYRGSRVECYKKGHQNNIHAYDVNSMYPDALTKIQIPDLRTEKHLTKPTQTMLTKEILDSIGIIKATISTPTYQDIMYLPIRYNGCQIYPYNAKITSWWTTLEIKKAKTLGYQIEEIHELIHYKPTPINPFKKYLETLYEQRKNKHGMMKATLKLLMNSLYGRWAMQITDTEEQMVHRQNTLEWRRKGYLEVCYIGEQVLMVKEGKKKPSNQAHPIISLLTTAKARDNLYNNLIKIPFADLIYTDTDSIICNNDHSHKLDIGNELGQWKTEISEADGFFAKEKNYMIGNKIVTSGVSNKTATLEYLQGKQTAKVKQMYTHNQALKSGNIEKTGTFQTVHKNIQALSKRQIIYPEIITDI